MKYKSLIGFVWGVVIVSMFTSCLKDINNIYNPGTTAAVVRQHGDSALMMANTRFGWIYATGLSSYSEGKCLLVSFDYDPSLPENADAEQKGYYTVTLQGGTAVDQQNAKSPLTDTHKLLTNEQPVLAVNPYDSVLYIKLEDHLFLPSACRTTEGRTLSWQLTYDPAQQPVVEDQKSVYSLYLRAAATTGKPEDKAEEIIGVINAFNLSNFIKDMREQGGSDADMYIQIHYIDQINPEDSTQFTWGVTDPLLIN
ncbi:hypothetical protein [uncultured Parabacteroides sp.]|uniref:hypothetical protein n=1 Tax=uncultured Parabacteroides sp. TaxID=512312 RepID=UPI002631E176|nr:hypothetical protein [uncultured Parabacteroides sp.]